MKKVSKEKKQNVLKCVMAAIFVTLYVFTSVFICYLIALFGYNLFGENIPYLLNVMFGIVIFGIYCFLIILLSYVINKKLKDPLEFMIVCCIFPIIYFIIDYITTIELAIKCDAGKISNLFACGADIDISRLLDITGIVIFAATFAIYIAKNYVYTKKTKNKRRKTIKK